MKEIGKIPSGGNYDRDDAKTNYETKNINLDDINIVFTTKKDEKDRTTFENTFSLVDLSQSDSGKKFLDSLKNNKSLLMEKLDLTDEQYDTLACVAMGLASQETGMGEEQGYINENSGGFINWLRDLFKGGDKTSESSGITQMKIYDFMTQEGKLSPELKQLLNEMGVVATSKTDDNLYANPDKAAIATMVVLKAINDNYDDYMNSLKENHETIAEEIAQTPEERQILEDKALNLLKDIREIYDSGNDNQKKELREAFKMWFLAQNGSTRRNNNGAERGYNEEENLNKFNQILTKMDSNFEPLTEETLHYLRYALTDSSQAMNPVEYMAYGWNKGITGTGMQLDRFLAAKIGIILDDPEDFKYGQFETNVAKLAEKYANQSVGENGLYLMSDSFLDYFE